MTTDTLAARAYRVRQADNMDLAAIQSQGINRELWESILKFRFLSPADFFAQINDANKRVAFFVCVDKNAALIGWACCFRFHERQGYLGTVQFVSDACKPTSVAGWRRDLYLACEKECRQRGIHAFISFVHSGMNSLCTWHDANGFETCGGIDLDKAEKLYVFSKRIA